MNLDFFLGHLSNRFGKGGQVWEENRHQKRRGKDEGRRRGVLLHCIACPAVPPTRSRAASQDLPTDLQAL